MPLKNYTTQIPANRSIQEIQEMLQKHGASGSMIQYEVGTGRVESLSFRMNVNGQNWDFRLPIKWRGAQSAMLSQGVTKARDDDYSYRVAWRVLKDWVDVQMALIEIEMVDIQEVFLPYVVQKGGNTLYQNILENPTLLLN